MSELKVLKQGAEARIYRCDFSGRPAIAKQRFRKTYRNPVLDQKLTAKRVVQEARCLHRLRKAGINTPALYLLDTVNNTIYMEYVDGETVRDVLCNTSGCTELKAIAESIGSDLAQMHDMDLIHGDLTTSNIIVRRDTRTLVWIDFGLSYASALTEDKGVDLYVLERAILSTHPNEAAELFEHIVECYKSKSKNAKQVLDKFEKGKTRSLSDPNSILKWDTFIACYSGYWSF
ncbi:serine/threonine-protein kinase bud32 [Batrachochytrium dendrobatidis]